MSTYIYIYILICMTYYELLFLFRYRGWVSSPIKKNQAAKSPKKKLCPPQGTSRKEREDDGPPMDSTDIDPASNGLQILNNAPGNGVPVSRCTYGRTFATERGLKIHKTKIN